MSRRAKRAASRFLQAAPSASHYVGYVEDEENVDMIMKKFEAMEEYQRAMDAQQERKKQRQQKTAENESTGDEPLALVENDAQAASSSSLSNGSHSTTKTPSFSEEQLEDMFRLTSAFSVKSVIRDIDVDLMADQNALLLLEEFHDEDDVSDEEFWDVKKKRKNLSKGKRPSKAAKKSEPIYFLQELQSPDGFTYAVRKKVKSKPNLDAPAYVRVPPDPLPISWARLLHGPRGEAEQPVPGCSRYAADVLNCNLASIAPPGGFHAILMDPPLKSAYPSDHSGEHTITPEQLAKLKISSHVMPKGFIFCWVEKEHIQPLFKVMDQWGFSYVESFAWVQQTVYNKLLQRSYCYFNKSKLTLLIFRKRGKWQMELLHQRNPDVRLDFVRVDKESQRMKKTNFVYRIIETLLPEAKYTPETGFGRFLELWSLGNHNRSGWTHVVQTPGDQLQK